MKTKRKQKGLEILKVREPEKYATVEELFEKSHPGSVYYTLLFLSSVIVACGLLLSNPAVIIGGMLVTPFLAPILVIALGFSVGEMKATKPSAILVLKSALIVVIVSFILAILFGVPAGTFLLADSFQAAVLYFLVAFFAGAAATFAWARKEVAEILPGVAIAVSLVPPLSLLGIELSRLDFGASQITFLTFLLNFVGTILGSVIVFSLLKFYRTGKTVKKEAINQESGGKK